ncbi:FAD-binding domain-containing protein [Periconia macrospinosa]|uniref:FAD-binding domain-containing protein n=1 Tax=Periconia macrospinosa TaxID=97972 RepID=A0A2V1E5W5_9PLEO|nr:FAD-binding domain-containing protein [Periconia macrospinosa]
MLASLEPFKVAFPGRVVGPGDPTYDEEVCYSWSVTTRIPAKAYIYLSSKDEVAKVLTLLKATNCRFAIRSAGHNANPGFSSVDTSGTGVVLDLRGLNSKVLDKEVGVAHVGAGNNWADLFTWLEAEDLCVIGSREGRVGVSGFILGGGQGIFSSSHGLGADGVAGFEVVLANGEIVNANAESHSDLYKALKGGGSNFGIVTSISLRVHPLIKVQYTINTYDPSDYVNVISAFAKVQASMEQDPQIGLFINTRRSFIAIGYFYADWPTEIPEAFQPLQKLSSFLGAAVPTTNGTFTSLNSVLEQWAYKEKDMKHAYVTMTTRVQPDLYERGHEAWKAVVEHLSPAADLHWSIQPLTQRAVQAGRRLGGGNTLGLVDTPQSCWIFTCDWRENEHDEAVTASLDQVLQRIEALASEKDLLLDLRFPTFAGKGQNVLDSFGAEIVQKLRETALRYDPDRIFQSLQCGGFLLRDV